MIALNENITNMIKSPSRSIKGRVELYTGSALQEIFSYNDNLKSFNVERAGENGKFFGFGICQKLTTNIMDKDRKFNIDKNNTLECEFGVESDFVYPTPLFYVEDVARNENTNELTVTAYDILFKAGEKTVEELNLPASYTIEYVVALCANLLRVPLNIPDNIKTSFNILFPLGANFDGTEPIRTVLNMAAEATQTIYFINSQWELTFKRLNNENDAVLDVTKGDYFTFKAETEQILTSITNATELGDNVTATNGNEGTTQIIRNNGFLELREDIGEIMNQAIENVGNLSIIPFDLAWRGNFGVEIGDKMTVETKDNGRFNVFVLNDTLTYNGGFKHKSSWEHTATNETPANPSNLGDALKQTFAKVDKVNKQIEIVAGENAANGEAISQLKMDTSQISATVKATTENTNAEIETLTKKVDATMTPEDVTISIKQELAEGVDKVVTTTGFSFDEDGLTITKTDTEIKTNIDEDGLSVFKNDKEVLTADNKGVTAIDVKVKTYLIIGTNSRFEDYEDGSRTGCFWIGG